MSHRLLRAAEGTKLAAGGARGWASHKLLRERAQSSQQAADDTEDHAADTCSAHMHM